MKGLPKNTKNTMVNSSGVFFAAALLMLASIAFTGVTQALASEGGWEARLVVAVGEAENKLSLGQRPDATDGLDDFYEVPAMLGGDIRAWFEGPEGPLWRDIKAPGETAWSMKVKSGKSGETIKLSWDSARLAGDMAVSLVDLRSGASVDMKAIGSYTYKNAGPRRFKVEVRNLPEVAE